MMLRMRWNCRITDGALRWMLPMPPPIRTLSLTVAPNAMMKKTPNTIQSSGRLIWVRSSNRAIALSMEVLLSGYAACCRVRVEK